VKRQLHQSIIYVFLSSYLEICAKDRKRKELFQIIRVSKIIAQSNWLSMVYIITDGYLLVLETL
jgi:hypothetical protein